MGPKVKFSLHSSPVSFFLTESDSSLNAFSQNFGFQSNNKGGCSSSPSNSLGLDSERGELVKAPSKLGQKGATGGKSLEALKNHAEAERRRREIINSHLDTLWNLVPSTDKMDKVSVLAEVINHVEDLKRTALEARKGLVIPMDTDEVKVETLNDGMLGRPFSIKGTLCCDDHPEILPNLRKALEACKLETVKVEVSTLGGRMKNVVVGIDIFCSKMILWLRLSRFCMKLEPKEEDENEGTYSKLPSTEKYVYAKRMIQFLGVIYKVLSRAPDLLDCQPPILCNLVYLVLDMWFTRGYFQAIAYILKISPNITQLYLESKEVRIVQRGALQHGFGFADEKFTNFSTSC